MHQENAVSSALNIRFFCHRSKYNDSYETTSSLQIPIKIRSTCFVFNRVLALQKENNKAENKYILYTKMASWLVEWKSDTDIQWLKEAPSQLLLQSLKDLE